MRSIHGAMIALALTIPAIGAAQSGAVTPGGNDASSPGTTSPAPKKKGGPFGRVKGLAKNNAVKTIAKTAACTMIPGGQLVAGAIDGASAKNAAKDAAANAGTNAAAKAAKGVVAGAAAGALAGTGKGGNPCMPGMGMMGNPGAAAMARGVPGAGLPGMPNTTMPGVGLSPTQLKQMQEQYRKMGMGAAQIQAMQQMMVSPGAGLSAAQIKQIQEQYRKMGIDPAQLQAMQQQLMAGTAGGTVAAPADEAAQPDEPAGARRTSRNHVQR